MEHNKGFFGKLFDISFSEFISTRIIKILYVGSIILAAIMALSLFIRGIRTLDVEVGSGILFIIASPILFFVYVLIARVWLEIMIVIFRIAENTGKLAEQGLPEKTD